jgi:hypothetical protein
MSAPLWLVTSWRIKWEIEKKIVFVLQKEGPLCDSCLQQKTNIKNHATVDQINRELKSEGLLIRY